MQLLVLVIIAAILVRDGGLEPLLVDDGVLATLVVVGVPLLLIGLDAVLVARLGRRLDGGRGMLAIARSEHRARLVQFITVVAFGVGVLCFGWLDAIRRELVDTVLLDELASLAPTLVLVSLVWAVHWPLERRLREAVLLRRLDQGEPVYAIPSVGAHLVSMLRTHVALLLLPALVVLGLSEAIDVLLGAHLPVMALDGLRGIAAVSVLLVAPAFVVRALDTAPLASGDLRDAALEVAERSGVRVRDVLVWHTGGTMVNAAVMGILPSLRWVLLSDAMVDLLPRDELRAVMAHEIGHVRRRHLLWLGVGVIALASALGLVLDVLLGEALRDATIEAGALVALVVVGFVGFGWISRRFEWQADAFAAAYLSSDRVPAGGLAEGWFARPDRASMQQVDDDGIVPESAPGGALTSDTVTPRASGIMCGALGAVARWNGIATERSSWRHGSIRVRQRRLEAIVDRPLDALPIDRTVGRIKAASIVTLLGTILISLVLPLPPVPSESESDARTPVRSTPRSGTEEAVFRVRAAAARNGARIHWCDGVDWYRTDGSETMR